MGRSSREKRERQHHRMWSTTNPWTGAREQFKVRVSAGALREWEDDRVRLKDEGFPDRPPEFDTPTTRSWDKRISGAAAPKVESFMLAVDPSARTLGAWAIRDEVLALKANLGQRPDGELILDVRAGPVDLTLRYLLRGVESVAAAGKIVRDMAEALGLAEPKFVDAAQIIRDIEAGQRGAGARPH